jgi:UDPglucose 6-dehydrogenase
MITISVIGIGFVGSAIMDNFIEKGYELYKNLYIYDKFKNMGNMIDCLKSEIMFLALPTQFKLNEYDKTSIYETCEFLRHMNYKGAVVIKSTIEPETTDILSHMFPELNLIHNPEFLSAKTATEDFKNQKHIVIGKGKYCDDNKYNMVKEFYQQHFDATISECTSLESESMKIFCNSFYAIKIQFFTELYLLCQKNNCDFNRVKDMMLMNGWINSMHTNVPGNDGMLSYGGLCFPKDTMALNNYMIKKNSPNRVLENSIMERNEMRSDNSNIN